MRSGLGTAPAILFARLATATINELKKAPVARLCTHPLLTAQPIFRGRASDEGLKLLGKRVTTAVYPGYFCALQPWIRWPGNGRGRECLHFVRGSFSGADRSESGTIAHVSVSNRRSGSENGWE